MKRNWVFIIVFLLIPLSGISQIKLSPLFSDNMVLQQKEQVLLWGESKSEQVEIVTSWNNKKQVSQTNADGVWTVKVQTPQAGGPYTIKISNRKKSITLKNVMIGEVWLCSGQSNMEMQVEGWGKVNNYKEEVSDAKKYPNIRFLQVKKNTSPVPIDELAVTNDGWQVCSDKTVGDFSAAGYFFGRDLHESQNVPIGLIDSSWGGTYSESWTSSDALETLPSMVEKMQSVKKLPQSKEDRTKLFHTEIEEWKKEIEKADKGFENDKAIWASQELKDSSWEEMIVPGIIQEQGLEGFNGVVWFKTTIDIPKKWENKNLTLDLGPIDDNDFTYFNGVQIGHTEGWMTPRSYKIPKDLVKEGKATIAVRLMDTGGTGGIYGDPKALALKLNTKEQISLQGMWKYKVSLNKEDIPPMPVNLAEEPNVPSYLYNAMIHPLVPFKIKGAIWYQGEANTWEAYEYRKRLPLLITDWRNKWNESFPFYIVQLASFTAMQTEPVESGWAELREAQLKTLHLENTGLAVAIDIGESFDIHPKNKQDVGKRLALVARAKTYGEKIPYSGPVFKNYRIEGDKIRLYFDHIEGGLKTKDGGELKGFTIAGVDQKFYWANAKIEDNTIVVSSSNVDFPVAVRYAWADHPICNLYNVANLPATPFRTDEWAGITYKTKK